MRITTNMIRRNYQNNLASSMGGLEQARRQTETGRRYGNAYENPSAFAKAAVLETRYARNTDYLNSVKDMQKWQDTQEDVLTQISSMAKEIDKNYSIQAITDSTSEMGRDVFAKNLRELQKSMVATLNTKYGNTYVMAGSDGMNAPFNLEDDGTLTYRGLDVNDPANQAVLDQLARDTSYVDLGFGMDIGPGGIVPSSAFNSAYPGINLVGYGQTADGTSKNLIVLAGQMADLLEAKDFDKAAYEKLWTQFSEGSNATRDQLAEIGTKTQLLASTEERLTNEKLNITAQYDSAVNIDSAEAIMNFSWAQYVYNASLKIGTSVLSPSLLDFMQ